MCFSTMPKSFTSTTAHEDFFVSCHQNVMMSNCVLTITSAYACCVGALKSAPASDVDYHKPLQ